MRTLLLVLLTASAAAAGCIELYGDSIRAADLASRFPSLAGRTEPIGHAPSPGVERVMTAIEVRRHAERLGVPAGEQTPICFVRQTVPLSRDEFERAIASALDPGTAFELVRFGPQHGPVGTLEFPKRGFARMPSGKRNTGIWRGRLRYSQAGSIPAWAEVHFKADTDVLVAARSLSSGHILQLEDMRLEKRPASPFQTASAVSAESLAGRALRHSIAQGRELGLRDVENPPEVSRGEAVRIEASFGQAFLTLQGVAEAPGRIGDIIPVRTTDNGKAFKARVQSKGVVSVGGRV